MTGDLRRMSVVLFEGFELLDVFGPAELFSLVPGQARHRVHRSPEQGLPRAASAFS